MPDQPKTTRVDRFFMNLAAQPDRALLVFAVFAFACWTILPLSVATAPRLDVVEGLIWGREWLIGTFKHPPLPSWLIEISLYLTGSPVVGPVIFAELCVAGTYALVYLTGKRVTTARNALIGTVLLAGIVHFTWPTPELNHNVVQLPIWSGAVLLLLIARQEPSRPLPWLWLGVLSGVGIYAKYSVFVLYFAIAVWILYEARLRRAVATPWPWLGAALAILIALPHILWLLSSDLSSVENVSARGGRGSLLVSLDWLLTQAGNHAPLLLFGAIVGFRRIARQERAAEASPDLAFIVYFAVAPALFSAVVAAALGIGMVDLWGMPMFTMSGLAIVLLLNRTWTDYLTGRALATGMGFVFVIAVAYAIIVGVSPGTKHLQRDAWPMKELAAQFSADWYERTDMPLKIISGDPWLAGLIANGIPERPTVIYSGSLKLSPWIDPDDLGPDGVLYVWRGENPPAGLLPAGIDLDTGTVTLPGRLKPGEVLGYAIRLPETP